jgi:hypothetical protein
VLPTQGNEFVFPGAKRTKPLSNMAATSVLRRIVLEVTIRGQHLGISRGLPATGAQIELSLCGIYTFDGDDRLAGERIYYDRATLFRQLGVFRERDSAMGRISTLLTHPLTMARIVSRKIWTRS